MNRVWNRLSHYSTATFDIHYYSPSVSRTTSLETIPESFDSISLEDNQTRQSVLLPPAPILSCQDYSSSVIDSRLSSALEPATPPPSPITAKRSDTPLLLDQLSSDLEAFKLSASRTLAKAYRFYELDDADRTTLNSSSSLATMSVDNVSCSSEKLRNKASPSALTLNPRQRNISPPLPSPVNQTPFATSGPPSSASAYQYCRPAPRTPEENHEVSCIDWDDDEGPSRLTRVKKSITDLRNASRVKASSSAIDRPKLSISPTRTPKPSMQETFRPAFVQRVATHPHHPVPTPSAKLSKPQILKTKTSRSRAGSHASTISTASAVTGRCTPAKPSTPLSVRTASMTTTALPSPSDVSRPTPKQKRRFSISGRNPGRKFGMGRLRRLFAKILAC